MLDFGVPPVARDSRSLGALRAARAAARRTPALAGLARGRTLPRSEHPRLRGAPAAGAPARAVVGGRACGRSQARRLSLGGGVVVWGRREMSVERRPAFYALAQGGWRDYVTLLHLPYTLWHLSYVAIGAALCPELAGQPAALGARGIRARPRRRCARTRRAAQPPAADGDPAARARSGSPPHLSSPRSRSESAPRSRGRSGCCRSSPQARSSSPRTPSSSVGAASTRISGSASPGAPSRCWSPTWAPPRRCGPRPSSRRRSRCSRAWRSARSRPRCGRCGAGSRA